MVFVSTDQLLELCNIVRISKDVE